MDEILIGIFHIIILFIGIVLIVAFLVITLIKIINMWMRRDEKINLKCNGVQLWGDGQTRRRYKQTLKRVKPYVIGTGNVLNAGESSVFGDKMAKELNLIYWETYGDLNYTHRFTEHEYVFCFEVIEHLMNPLSRLRFS